MSYLDTAQNTTLFNKASMPATERIVEEQQNYEYIQKEWP
jgi:hypothetical protein